jgi:hypothetical protein
VIKVRREMMARKVRVETMETKEPKDRMVLMVLTVHPD